YIHPKQRVPCDWPGCEGLFKNYKYVNKHKNALHLRTKRYPCEWPGCGYEARVAHSLKNHRVVHTKARSLKCDWPGCEYSAGVSWALVAHKRIHTGEKPYACDWPDCAYRCSQPCTLISHKRKHTGEKPIETYLFLTPFAKRRDRPPDDVIEGHNEDHNDSGSDSEDSNADDGNDEVNEQEIKQLEEELSVNSYDYQKHVDLIDKLEACDDLELIRAARERMSKLFPLTPNLWLKWINDEIRIASTADEKSDILKLFERSVEDYISLDVWLEYVHPPVVDEDLNLNDIVANDVKTEITLACDEESNETIKNGNSGQISDECNEDTRVVAIDINDTQSDDKSENSFNVCDMDVLYDSDCTQSDDKSVKSEDLGCVDDLEDSDYGVKRRSQRRRKTPNRSQVSTEMPKSERQKRIDDLVLHLKVGDQYVCDQIGCDYKSGVKRQIYSHMLEHNPNGRRIRSSFKVNREDVEKTKTIARQKRINDLVFHLQVDDQYVCDVEECNFKTGVKREMYRHKIDHKADDREAMNPFDEQKLEERKRIILLMKDFKVDDQYVCKETEERKRIILLMKDFKVDDQYVCKETGCDFTSKNEMQFYYHQRRHQRLPASRGPRGNHADWLTRIKGTGVDAEGNYVCSRPNCVFAAKEKEEFFDHFKQHMDALIVENGQQCNSGRLYPCDYPKCPKTVSTVIDFYQHERYIHPKQRVPCDWPGCEGLFKNYKYVNKQ
ncbi:unnamed protein product, partial [Medioppia subpectinata]